jgi:hypothetical protein
VVCLQGKVTQEKEMQNVKRCEADELPSKGGQRPALIGTKERWVRITETCSGLKRVLQCILACYLWRDFL